MLVELSITNYRSFGEKQTFSMAASRDKAHPGSVINGKLISDKRFNLLKAAAVYGANASGKSNLIRGISLMRDFVVKSATKMNQGDTIAAAVPFRLSASTQSQPTSFSVVILVDNIRYEYGFAATSRRVHEEWLYACAPEGRWQRWFERRLDPASEKTSWTPIKGLRRGVEKILVENTRENGLMLSVAAQLNVEPFVPVYKWFRERLAVVAVPGFAQMADALGRMRKDHRFRERIGRIVRHADFGIEGFVLKDETVQLPEATSPADDFVRKMESLVQMMGGEYQVRFPALSTVHRVQGSDTSVEFSFQDDESQGTQRFFELIVPVLDAIDKGAVMVVDELELHMHPLLSRKIVELFQSDFANKRGAQLIFTTHDSTLLDQSLFRRDQVWLIEKKQRGTSELFSLHDFATSDRPRSNEAFQKNYLAGRYGAVPMFGPALEDGDLK